MSLAESGVSPEKHSEEPRPYNPTRAFVRRFARNRLALLGLVLVLLMAFIALFAPLIAPMNPIHAYFDGTTAQGQPLGPTWQWHHFFLGSNPNGQDELSQLIYGARVSMEVGVMATLIMIAIGTLIGMIAGYSGGIIDNILMRLTDIMLAFPFMLFVILLRSVISHPTTATVFLAIGVLGWAPTARIARGQSLAARNLEYVEAARALGAKNRHIIWKHIVPNTISAVVVFGTLQVASNILLESALSFLGVGVPDPTPSWGKMINLGLQYYQGDPLLIIWPGIMVVLATLGFNLLGDGLSDALNVRTQLR